MYIFPCSYLLYDLNLKKAITRLFKSDYFLSYDFKSKT